MTYFSNGCEGEVLDEQCCNCLIGMENYCPVAYVQMENNYKQIASEGRFRGYRNPIVDGIMQCLIRNGRCEMKDCIDKALARSVRKLHEK